MLKSILGLFLQPSTEQKIKVMENDDKLCAVPLLAFAGCFEAWAYSVILCVLFFNVLKSYLCTDYFFLWAFCTQKW